ncbi:hypothetical protein TPAR_05577 [Tolypocladium paradoxum]|uniref:Uncharacterized protein n=1 Tax=Tolypocladium paradoxum TaxID=94208 RepID=A0A2S4KVR6_9HYPO|nr:hypothetical protein TPAR_05577 [Tolypocladium paradoxum]
MVGLSCHVVVGAGDVWGGQQAESAAIPAAGRGWLIGGPAAGDPARQVMTKQKAASTQTRPARDLASRRVAGRASRVAASVELRRLLRTPCSAQPTGACSDTARAPRWQVSGCGASQSQRAGRPGAAESENVAALIGPGAKLVSGCRASRIAVAAPRQPPANAYRASRSEQRRTDGHERHIGRRSRRRRRSHGRVAWIGRRRRGGTVGDAPCGGLSSSTSMDRNPCRACSSRHPPIHQSSGVQGSVDEENDETGPARHSIHQRHSCSLAACSPSHLLLRPPVDPPSLSSHLALIRIPHLSALPVYLPTLQTGTSNTRAHHHHHQPLAPWATAGFDYLKPRLSDKAREKLTTLPSVVIILDFYFALAASVSFSFGASLGSSWSPPQIYQHSRFKRSLRHLHRGISGDIARCNAPGTCLEHVPSRTTHDITCQLQIAEIIAACLLFHVFIVTPRRERYPTPPDCGLSRRDCVCFPSIAIVSRRNSPDRSGLPPRLETRPCSILDDPVDGPSLSRPHHAVWHASVAEPAILSFTAIAFHSLS